MAVSPYSRKRRLSIWSGTFFEVACILLGFVFLYFSDFTHPALGVLLLLASWFCLWFFSHCLTHLIVGRVLGMHFRFYFIGRSSLLRLNLPGVPLLLKRFPVLGIKIADESFRRVEPRKRALMFASGALASMTFPLISVFYAWLYLPTWITVIVGVFTASNILFTSYFSSKAGDFWKAKTTLKNP